MPAIPVLAGSAAYAVCETFGCHASLESKPRNTRKFYYLITFATILGVCLNLLGFDPIRALFGSALVNGMVAAPLLFSLMLISVNPAIVGKFRLALHLRIAGWAATLLMATASLALIVTEPQRARSR